jgi:hypothetical protein
VPVVIAVIDPIVVELEPTQTSIWVWLAVVCLWAGATVVVGAIMLVGEGTGVMPAMSRANIPGATVVLYRCVLAVRTTMQRVGLLRWWAYVEVEATPIRKTNTGPPKNGSSSSNSKRATGGMLATMSVPVPTIFVPNCKL